MYLLSLFTAFFPYAVHYYLPATTSLRSSSFCLILTRTFPLPSAAHTCRGLLLYALPAPHAYYTKRTHFRAALHTVYLPGFVAASTFACYLPMLCTYMPYTITCRILDSLLYLPAAYHTFTFCQFYYYRLRILPARFSSCCHYTHLLPSHTMLHLDYLPPLPACSSLPIPAFFCLPPSLCVPYHHTPPPSYFTCHLLGCACGIPLLPLRSLPSWFYYPSPITCLVLSLPATSLDSTCLCLSATCVPATTLPHTTVPHIPCVHTTLLLGSLRLVCCLPNLYAACLACLYFCVQFTACALRVLTCTPGLFLRCTFLRARMHFLYFYLPLRRSSPHTTLHLPPMPSCLPALLLLLVSACFALVLLGSHRTACAADFWVYYYECRAVD